MLPIGTLVDFQELYQNVHTYAVYDNLIKT